jgi:thiol-disulfide isomerase/thioredoxin
MALTPTIDIPLGFKAPDFNLLEPKSGKILSLNDLKSDKGTVIMFICNHCPYVVHTINGIKKLANDYSSKGISFIAINSNDVENYPEDSPEKMIEYTTKGNYPFPYLYDETQEVARKYNAACTPDFNIFDGDMKCVYRGQLDNSRPGNNIPVTGESMRNALDLLLKNKEIQKDQKPSIEKSSFRSN